MALASQIASHMHPPCPSHDPKVAGSNPAPAIYGKYQRAPSGRSSSFWSITYDKANGRLVLAATTSPDLDPIAARRADRLQALGAELPGSLAVPTDVSPRPVNMLSQIARIEFADAGVGVSVVYPSVTAIEFHQRLRAGRLVSGGRRIPPDPPEFVAEAIVFALHTGEPHVLAGRPPTPIAPGDSQGWGALLARQAPTGPQGGESSP